METLPWLLLIMLFSGFGVNIGLGACFWVCFAWVRALFLGFSLLYGFSDRVLTLCHPFPGLFDWCLHREMLSGFGGRRKEKPWENG